MVPWCLLRTNLTCGPNPPLFSKTMERHMSKCHFAFALGITMTFSYVPTYAQDTARTIGLAGTVVAKQKTALSYTTRGCITGVSKSALTTGRTSAGDILVELDNRAATLALKSAQARVADLQAAVEERDYAIFVATADISRMKEEQDFVNRDFERTRIMFQRGLVNETTLDGAERKKLDATFAVQRADEALVRAVSAKSRAINALEIAELDVSARELDLDALLVRAPFEGILLNFEPRIGDCVNQGSVAAEIYDPNHKSVETYVFVDQIVNAKAFGIVVGSPVNVIRINGDTCRGMFTLIGTEVNLESQNVKTTIDLDPDCAPHIFLNEAVAIETVPENN